MVTGIGQWRARLTAIGPTKRYMALDELSASMTVLWGRSPCGPMRAAGHGHDHPRHGGTFTPHPHVEVSRQARVMRRPARGERALTSSGASAETGKQPGLSVRVTGHRRPRGDRAGTAVSLLRGFEPGRAGRDELFVQALVRADSTGQVPRVDQVVGEQLQRV